MVLKFVDKSKDIKLKSIFKIYWSYRTNINHHISIYIYIYIYIYILHLFFIQNHEKNKVKTDFQSITIFE